eukprot:scaffold121_cov412-Prasinococcus_capsulatus_cf.AAC.27
MRTASFASLLPYASGGRRHIPYGTPSPHVPCYQCSLFCECAGDSGAPTHAERVPRAADAVATDVQQMLA